MNQDPSPGEAARVRGSVKEAIGKLTGDAKAQAEGRAEKAEGK
ncbi:CsbD family protein, partial [Roseomonas sp. KE2513]